MKKSYVLNIFAVSGALAGAVVLGGSVAARGGSCTEIPTVWTMSSTFVDGSASRIYSDGLGSYSDGTAGVTARIRCGTNDAVLMPGNRHVMFNLGGALLGTADQNPPSWTTGSAFASPPATHKVNCGGSPCTVVNVRNILDGGNTATAPRNAYYMLYTRLDTGFAAPDNVAYHLPMHNASTSNVASDSDDAFVNAPFSNARVVVEHYPANYQGTGNTEYWLAYPESPTMANSMSPSPENGTLESWDRTLNLGQFSVPFYFKIEVK